VTLDAQRATSARRGRDPRVLEVRTVDVAALVAADPDAMLRRPAWLAPAEWEEAAALHHPARRAQWLAGRLAAKRALAAVGALAACSPGGAGAGAAARRANTAAGGLLARLVVRTRDGAGRPVAPRVLAGGRPLAVALSIAHGEHLAVAAAAHGRRPLGLDVVEPGALAAGHRLSLDAAGFALLEALAKASGRPLLDPLVWRAVTSRPPAPRATPVVLRVDGVAFATRLRCHAGAWIALVERRAPGAAPSRCRWPRGLEVRR
jgi:4'-phosphopantetheinyl transferase EntD